VGFECAGFVMRVLVRGCRCGFQCVGFVRRVLWCSMVQCVAVCCSHSVEICCALHSVLFCCNLVDFFLFLCLQYVYARRRHAGSWRGGRGGGEGHGVWLKASPTTLRGVLVWTEGDTMHTPPLNTLQHTAKHCNTLQHTAT